MLIVRPSDLDPTRQELAALELQVAERESTIVTFQRELQRLQTAYLTEVGALYAELTKLEAEIFAEEIRAGLRQPPGADEDDADDEAEDGGAACSNRAEPSADLKRMFRDLAKTIHPDLAPDDAARYRRHSPMAEANRAYAERDEDRLRLILRVWERSPEAVIGDDPEADQLRLRRRVQELGARLVELDAAMADLRDSAIARLKRKIDGAHDQGWDLFAEMVRQVKREVATSRARLASLRR